MRISGLLLSIIVLKLYIPQTREFFSLLFPSNSWPHLVVIIVHNPSITRPSLVVSNGLLNVISFSSIRVSVLIPTPVREVALIHAVPGSQEFRKLMSISCR